MAASVVFTIPIVIAFFAQKTFIQGIKLTGINE
jgi:ABC-type glycerol-3-phosphate transport system permease component